MSHRYYVTYSHAKGTGAIDITCDEPLSDWGQIQAVRAGIAENEQKTDPKVIIDQIVVLNWRQYDPPGRGHSHDPAS